MANKKTVVQMYEEILAINGLTDEQKAFLEKRIEITKKKNANRGNGELTPKQKEKLAAEKVIEDKVLSVIAENADYTPSEIVKLVALEDVPNTQKLTPRLTALVKAEKLIKDTVKGRSVYRKPAKVEDTDTEE